MLAVITDAIIAGSLYGLLAASFALVAAPQRTFNLSGPLAALVASYAAFWGTAWTGSLLLGGLLACLASMAFSTVVQRFIVGHLLRRGDPQRGVILASIGLLGVVQAAFGFCFSSELITMNQIEATREAWKSLTQSDAALVLHLIVIGTVALALWLVLYVAPFGLKYRAVTDNRAAGELYCIGTTSVDYFACVLAGVVAGAAGFLLVTMRATAPHLATPLVLWAITGSIVGGRLSPLASLFGGVLLGVLEVVAMQHVSSSTKNIAIGTLLVLMLICRPQGIFGRQHRKA